MDDLIGEIFIYKLEDKINFDQIKQNCFIDSRKYRVGILRHIPQLIERDINQDNDPMYELHIEYELLYPITYNDNNDKIDFFRYRNEEDVDNIVSKVIPSLLRNGRVKVIVIDNLIFGRKDKIILYPKYTLNEIITRLLNSNNEVNLPTHEL